MKALFRPHLVNESHQDPALYIELFGRREAYLVDLGDISRLSTRKILRISRVFVSHTHIDHFFGFDTLLRLSLGRRAPLHLYGPKHFIRNVKGRLQGYTWNLIRDYPLVLYVHEFHKGRLTTVLFTAKDNLKPRDLGTREIANGLLHDDDELSVRTLQLNHKVPVLSFMIEEKKRLNVRKDVLDRMGAIPGRWLNELKKRILVGDSAAMIDVPAAKGLESHSAGDLARELLLVNVGEKILYVTDIKYSKKDMNKLAVFAPTPDFLYCEAFFTHEDLARARDRYHLTALQTNEIARTLGARKLIIFHFSPRYKGQFRKLFDEAYRGMSR